MSCSKSCVGGGGGEFESTRFGHERCIETKTLITTQRMMTDGGGVVPRECSEVVGGTSSEKTDGNNNSNG